MRAELKEARESTDVVVTGGAVYVRPDAATRIGPIVALLQATEGIGSIFVKPGSEQPVPAGALSLDIAGVADVKADKLPFAIGPTGFGVRLLVRAAEKWGE